MCVYTDFPILQIIGCKIHFFFSIIMIMNQAFHFKAHGKVQPVPFSGVNRKDIRPGKDGSRWSYLACIIYHKATPPHTFLQI